MTLLLDFEPFKTWISKFLLENLIFSFDGTSQNRDFTVYLYLLIDETTSSQLISSLSSHF